MAVLVAMLALGLRLPGLGDFMTVDEEQWMLRSGTFWHELFRQGDATGTFLTTHPGATVMWLAGAGVAWQEARVGFDIDTSNLRHFRLAATLPVALATSFLIGLTVWLLARVLAGWEATLAGLVLATDPYLTGMSQIAHLDALLALFMLGGVLAFFVWRREGKLWFLVLSGVLTGLAMATKLLPSLWLWPFFGLMLVFRQPLRPPVLSRLLASVRVLGFMFGVAMLTLYVAWPALWVSQDFMRSFNRDVPAVMTQEHVALEKAAEPITPASFYGRTVLGRSTPFVLLVAAGMLVAGSRFWMRRREVPLVAWFFVYAIGFLLLMTLAAKKADRYALPALVVLPVIAGWGVGVAIEAFKELPWFRKGNPPEPERAWCPAAGGTSEGEAERAPHAGRGDACSPCGTGAVLMITILLTAQVLLWSPYAIAYNNPYFSNIRPLSQQGWGEGLDAAARWLNGRPLADKLMVASWYSGVTGTYFKSKTMSLSSRDDKRVGYVVTYRNMAGRAPDDVATNVLDEFRGRVPARGIYIGGRPYVWIYETLGLHYFPQHVGELVGDMEVGQEVIAEKDGWSAIDIGMANFSSRKNTRDVILHVRENVNATGDLRTAVVNAAQIEDSAWHRFEFEPVDDAAGKTYYVALTSPDSVAGDAVTARFVEEDVLLGRMLLRRRAIRAGEKNSDFWRDGDLAYRLR